jgi:hypothetical protein
MLWARPAITILGIDCPPVLGSTAAIAPDAAADPLGSCCALLRRELPGVSYRPDRDELTELGSGLRHQAGNALSQPANIPHQG